MEIRKFWTLSAAILMAVVFGMSGQTASPSSLTSETTVGVTTVAATQDQDTALMAAAAYRPYTAVNFRYNLIQRTGYDLGSRCQTHHTMPQAFSTYFGPKGIQIHDPQFGLWWDSTAGVASNHSDLSAQYNRDWKKWIDQNPNATKTTVLQFNTSMKIIYSKYFRC
ncbi:hypothetical protein [Arthrobacter psychrochitiniphilus]|uniref:hypothetical protein n=1 Tax=Arthrobacter psychrochitiniphilus TaxID=291045 RepID=UPI003F7C3227